MLTVNPIKLETGFRANSAETPYTWVVVKIMVRHLIFRVPKKGPEFCQPPTLLLRSEAFWFCNF